MVSVLAAGLDLVLPRRCGGCGRPATGLCAACQLALLGPVRRREFGAARLVPADGDAPLPVWCSAWYLGSVRRAIVAWKRHGQAELDVDMARAVRRVAEAVAPTLTEVLATMGWPHLTVVPIPSRLTNRWRRPGASTRQLALAVAGGLSDAGVTATVVTGLHRRLGAPDQAGRSTRQRMLGREGTTLVKPGLVGPVLLVDDVLTTGATLLDAERALARCQVATLGAIVLAATPKAGIVHQSLGSGTMGGNNLTGSANWDRLAEH